MGASLSPAQTSRLLLAPPSALAKVPGTASWRGSVATAGVREVEVVVLGVYEVGCGPKWPLVGP
jgi:hypothetical protein